MLTVTFCLGAAGFKKRVLVLKTHFIKSTSSQREHMKETIIMILKFTNTSAMEMHVFLMTIKKVTKYGQKLVNN